MLKPSMFLLLEKGINFFHTLGFSNPYIFATQYFKLLKNLSLKYQKCVPSGFKDQKI